MRVITETLLKEYREYLIAEEKSKATIEKYMGDLRKFQQYAGSQEVTKALVMAYKEQLVSSQRYEISSINSFLVALNRFFEFAGWYDKDGNELSKSAYYTLRVRNDKELYAKFEETVIDPNVTKWTFSAFDGDNAVEATGATDKEYNGLTLHVNNGDSISAEGLYWNAPGGTKSNSTTVVSNNRYIEFIPEKSGTISITYKGKKKSSNNYPIMYISCGDSTACMTKDVNDSQLEANKAYDNKAGDNQYATMTTELTAGMHYYIWGYYYNQSSANFTISEIVYDTTEN